MNRLADAIERLSLWAACLAAVILGLMTLLILLEIFLWNVFDVSTLLADEFASYGLAAIVLLGSGYCLKERGHIRITLLLAYVPPKVSRTLTFASTLASTLFVAYLCWHIYRMTASAWSYGTTSGTLTATPLWVPQALMLAGALVLLLQFLASTMRTFAAIRSGEGIF